MGRFHVELTSELPPGEAFNRLLDLDAHTALIPLTAVTADGPLRPGTRFTARTAIGRVGFDDPMLVLEHAPPGREAGRAVIVKTGRWIAGEIRLTVSATPEIGSRIEWHQDITAPWLPGFLDPVVTRLARLAYATAIPRLLRPRRSGIFGQVRTALTHRRGRP